MSFLFSVKSKQSVQLWFRGKLLIAKDQPNITYCWMEISSLWGKGDTQFAWLHEDHHPL